MIRLLSLDGGMRGVFAREILERGRTFVAEMV